MRKRRYELYNPETKVTKVFKPVCIRHHISETHLHQISKLEIGESLWCFGLRVKCVQ